MWSTSRILGLRAGNWNCFKDSSSCQAPSPVMKSCSIRYLLCFWYSLEDSWKLPLPFLDFCDLSSLTAHRCFLKWLLRSWSCIGRFGIRGFDRFGNAHNAFNALELCSLSWANILPGALRETVFMVNAALSTCLCSSSLLPPSSMRALSASLFSMIPETGIEEINSSSDNDQLQTLKSKSNKPCQCTRNSDIGLSNRNMSSNPLNINASYSKAAMKIKSKPSEAGCALLNKIICDSAKASN